jgi:ribonuclease P protein component
VVLEHQKPHTIRFTFRKEERLCSQKIIAGLFQPGFFISKYPIRIHAMETALPVAGISAQVMFVVGKKRFKRSVDRNQVKRILRELYRKQKPEIYKSLEAAGKTMAIAIFYTGNELPDYNKLAAVFALAIKKFIHEGIVK